MFESLYGFFHRGNNLYGGVDCAPLRLYQKAFITRPFSITNNRCSVGQDEDGMLLKLEKHVIMTSICFPVRNGSARKTYCTFTSRELKFFQSVSVIVVYKYSALHLLSTTFLTIPLY